MAGFVEFGENADGRFCALAAADRQSDLPRRQCGEAEEASSLSQPIRSEFELRV